MNFVINQVTKITIKGNPDMIINLLLYSLDLNDSDRNTGVNKDKAQKIKNK